MEIHTLGKPVKVTLTFTPQRAIETYAARFLLPAGGVYEVIQGDLQRDGMSGSSPRLEITIKALREAGSGEIIGEVRGMTPHVTSWEHVYLFITIDKQGATVSDKQPPPRPAPERPGSTKPPETPSPAATAGAPVSTPRSGDGARSPQQPKLGFNPVLAISEPPALGKPVEIKLTFTPVALKGLENRELYYTARIVPAPGVYELVSGQLEEKGRLLPGTHAIKATIKSVRTTSSGEIYGWVALRLSRDAVWGISELDWLFITITGGGATVSVPER